MLDAEHDVAVHLDEAAVAVVGEARIAARPREAFRRPVVEAEVEDRVHHAGHRGAGAGADGDEQRVIRVPKTRAGDPLDMGEARLDLGFEACGNSAARGVVGVAEFRRDGEAGRDGQADGRHLGEVGPLAAQQRAHPRIPVRRPPAEAVDPFGHGLAPRPRSTHE